MTFDRYLPCPGGTGKKVKFCCSDLLGELETIQRMLEGEQRLACLEHVQKTLEKLPDRACLLSVKALLHSELQQEEALVETLDLFEAKHPGNPVALAERAIYLAAHGEAEHGVMALQTALENITQEMPTRVYEAIGLLGRALLAEGNVLAAQAHLLLQAAIGGSEDPRAMSLLAPLLRSAEIPLLLRDELQLHPAPKGASWSQAHDQAAAEAMRGAWRRAAEQYETLANQHGEAPELLRNIAVLRSWLGQLPEATAAWRAYAANDSVALDDAVEAEAIAQLIDPDVEQTDIDLVAITFEVSDMESLVLQFTADRRTQQSPVDQTIPLEDEDQPPPQSVFILLDREMPETGVGIARSDAPNVLGQCYLFGRQTDREARMDFVVYRDADVDAAISGLKEVADSGLSDTGEERVLTQVTETQHRLTWNWRLPPDTPPAERNALVAEQRCDVILNGWPTIANPMLDGKTPQQAAQDDSLRVPLLAAILVLDMSAGSMQSSVDFDELRGRLELPRPAPIPASDADTRRLPLIRMARLDVEQLSDEQLLEAYRRTAMLSVSAAIRRIAPEVIRRDSLDDKVDKAEAYGILSRQVEDSEEALQLLEKARETAIAASQSPAPWLLAELEVRLVRGEVKEAEDLLRELQTRHISEPGIGQAVYELLARMGVIDPRAMAAGAPGMPPAAPGPQSPPAGGQDEIWTPDAAAPSGPKKSAIWTPDD